MAGNGLDGQGACPKEVGGDPRCRCGQLLAAHGDRRDGDTRDAESSPQDGDDIYGDGVNIAARLEQLAEPGGVCISGTAYEHLKAKVDVGYADLGAQQVKNSEKPVRVYRVLLEPGSAGTLITEASKKRKSQWLGVAAFAVAVIAVAATTLWWRPWVEQVDKPSIAVLPLANLSGDPEQEYFADGMTEDIITD